MVNMIPRSKFDSAAMLFMPILLTSCGNSVGLPEQGSASMTCGATRVPVTLQEGAATTYEVAVTLCSLANAKTIQLLLHGSTYGGSYWEFPYQPERYSYVRAMHAQGLATLVVERIGVQPSDQPPAEEMSMEGSAHTIHQIVEGLRSGVLGTLSFPGFEKVILVGHSMGSAVAIEEAASYNDVDGLIITGLMQQFLGDGLAKLSQNLYPAQDDPKFANRNVPQGYQTTRPETRGELFYRLDNADPVVIAADEELKQTHALMEGITLFESQRKSSLVSVPVWGLVGQHDSLFCGADADCSAPGITEAEASYWQAAPCFELTVVADMGHSINLHYGADKWYAEAVRRMESGVLCAASGS